MLTAVVPQDLRADVETFWAYHDMRHELRPCDVGIGLGSHDLGVAIYIAELYQQGMFPRVVFTGSNAPTTIDRFPRGEAVHYRDHAVTLGVPAEVISMETNASNTSENLTFSRKILEKAGVRPSSVLLVSRPYQQRRAYATCRKVWPEVDVVCASRPLPLDDYVASIRDVDRVIDMLVGGHPADHRVRTVWLRHRAGRAARRPRRVPAIGRRRLHQPPDLGALASLGAAQSAQAGLDGVRWLRSWQPALAVR